MQDATDCITSSQSIAPTSQIASVTAPSENRSTTARNHQHNQTHLTSRANDEAGYWTTTDTSRTIEDSEIGSEKSTS